jgi:hypothetical protein
MFETLAQYLTDASIGLKLGRNLFIHALPAEVNEGAMLRDYFGGTPINAELPGYIKTRLQLVVRNPDYLSGRAQIDAASAALDFQDVTLDGMQVNYLRPVTKPFVFPRMVNGAWEMLVNFDLCYVETA